MNLDEMIKVGMADLKTCKSPEVLTTLGLGFVCRCSNI